ncbi:MAG: hypothetical protein COV36_07930 [Alphaproteobacteria bacterium CG11_big_fil_rev_8_21_14_0_20_44_7]|nr:MAG: hypothetical protein COV36_07930 [Alphaproteobacteria bacterium CG11_big_fil_rev_8_21_14_0_20_44_7]
MAEVASINSAAISGKPTAALEGLANDFDKFLTLLTVQLQNQDPTEPLDTNQLTDQIVQFTQAEQLVNMNTKLDKVVEGINLSMNSSAVSYVGRIVEYQDETFNLTEGAANVSYELPKNADSVEISITTTSGKVLRVLSGEKSIGSHDLDWDGKDKDGNEVADGEYRVSIAAKDDKGGEITVPVKVSDVVTHAGFEDGELFLFFGDIKVPSNEIVSIRGSVSDSQFSKSLDALGNLNNSTLDGFDLLNGSVNQSTLLTNTLSMINKNVEYYSEGINLANGQGDVSYRINQELNQVKYIIKDSEDNILYQSLSPASVGKHSVAWDGSVIGGANAPDGKYAVEILGLDSAGNEVDLIPFKQGTIGEIDLLGGEPTLYVGGNPIGIAHILRILN